MRRREKWHRTVKEHHLLYAESTPNYAKDLGASSRNTSTMNQFRAIYPVVKLTRKAMWALPP
jgi:hypothetical protein